ncbi:uncharacterized protein LOC144317031 [Canis aureus]
MTIDGDQGIAHSVPVRTDSCQRNSSSGGGEERPFGACQCDHCFDGRLLKDLHPSWLLQFSVITREFKGTCHLERRRLEISYSIFLTNAEAQRSNLSKVTELIAELQPEFRSLIPSHPKKHPASHASPLPSQPASERASPPFHKVRQPQLRGFVCMFLLSLPCSPSCHMRPSPSLPSPAPFYRQFLNIS